MQRLNQETPIGVSMRTPRHTTASKRRHRRATICNKENILPITSTPMVAASNNSGSSRLRNSPLVMAPLMDILNVTPEPSPNNSPVITRRRVQSTRVNRRHSTIGLTIPAVAPPPYATTLPRFEEEYSPSTALPSGQELALRGMLPDPFLEQARYMLKTPQTVPREDHYELRKSLPQKRNLDQDFVEIAQEEGLNISVKTKVKGLNSDKMGDQTLDKLIDAILDSACKDEKKKKPRKSTFNLRRRTLLKNQANENVPNLVLSPSYAAGDDPASDLSFLMCDAAQAKTQSQSPLGSLKTPDPIKTSQALQLSETLLRKMPTPDVKLGSSPLAVALLRKQSDSFNLDTPVRKESNSNKRRKTKQPEHELTPSKKFKVDAEKYFEIGLALPSIYV